MHTVQSCTTSTLTSPRHPQRIDAFYASPQKALPNHRLVRVHASSSSPTKQAPSMTVTDSERASAAALLQGQGLEAGETPEQAAVRILRRAAVHKDVSNDTVIAAMALMELQHAINVPLQALEGTWRLVFSSSSTLPIFQYIPVDEDALITPAHNTIDLVTRFGPLVTAFKGSFTFSTTTTTTTEPSLTTTEGSSSNITPSSKDLGPSSGFPPSPSSASPPNSNSSSSAIPSNTITTHSDNTKTTHSDMQFGFSRLEVLWNGEVFWETKLTIPVKTYRYFWTDGEGIVLARSSDGGVTLLYKVD